MGALHLIGFEPFMRSEAIGVGEGKMVPNPSEEFLKFVRGDEGGAKGRLLEAAGAERLSTHLLPVPMRGGEMAEAYEEFRVALQGVLDQIEADDTVLAMGQGHFIQAPLRLETKAVPSFKFGGLEISLDDEAEAWVMAEGDLARIKAGAQADDGLRDGLEISDNAGAFYCNALLWSLKQQDFGPSAWFFHLPFFTHEDQVQAFLLEQAKLMERINPGKIAKDFPFISSERLFVLVEAFLKGQYS